MTSTGAPQISDVSLVVVTYRSSALLADFFAALPEALRGVPASTVVVADNASDDGSLELARMLWPEGLTVRIPTNRGYAAGINAGIAAAPPSRAYLVLNPDIRLRPGSVARLLAALALPCVGIAVPQLRDESDRLLWSLRRDPSLLRALGEAMLGGHRAGRHDALGELVVGAPAYRSPRHVDWATGGAMALSAACVQRVGAWDETFFLYSEEVDYALRAREAGFSIRYEPEAVATRLVGDGTVHEAIYAMMQLNKHRLYARRRGRLRGALYWSALALGEAIRAIGGRTQSQLALWALSQRWDVQHLRTRLELGRSRA